MLWGILSRYLDALSYYSSCSLECIVYYIRVFVSSTSIKVNGLLIYIILGYIYVYNKYNNIFFCLYNIVYLIYYIIFYILFYYLLLY